MRARIAGTGSHLPARRITTAELAERAGVPADALRRRMGVDARHVARTGETTSDLAVVAAREALAAAGAAAAEVDCVVFATQSPDYYLPGSGPIMAAKMDLVGLPAIDLRAQCSGFLYGLSVADHFIRLGTYRRVLVVASEVMSASGDPATDDPDSVIFTGDGAAAALVVPEADGERGILGTGLHSDGRFARSIMLQLPSDPNPPRATSGFPALGPVYTVGGFEILEEGYKRLSEALSEALATCGLVGADVSLFIPNQGALQVATLLLRRLRIPIDRVVANAERGNPGAASLPICLDEAVRGGRVRPGDVVLMLSFGSGFTWAWAAVRW